MCLVEILSFVLRSIWSRILSSALDTRDQFVVTVFELRSETLESGECDELDDHEDEILF